MIIDFADMVAGQRRYGEITDENYESWARFMRAYYDTSPAVRHCWAYFGTWFPPNTTELLVGPSVKRGDPSVVPRLNLAPQDRRGARTPDTEPEPTGDPTAPPASTDAPDPR